MYFILLTFQLVIQVLQNDPDHLDQRQDQGAKSQRACVIPGEGRETDMDWVSRLTGKPLERTAWLPRGFPKIQSTGVSLLFSVKISDMELEFNTKVDKLNKHE